MHRAVGHDDLVVAEPVADHEAGFRRVLAAFEQTGVPGELAAVGHRVVHGGVRFDGPVLVDDEVLAAIRELTPLAPLHNPANALGIEVARRPIRTRRRWRCSTPPSTGRCRPGPTGTRCPGSWPTGTASAASASTAPRTSTCRGGPPSTSAGRSRSSR